MIAAG